MGRASGQQKVSRARIACNHEHLAVKINKIKVGVSLGY